MQGNVLSSLIQIELSQASLQVCVCVCVCVCVHFVQLDAM